MFDELLFAMAKEQNSQRVWKVDVGRVQRAEIARRNRAKKAGIKPIRGKFSALPDMWHALDVMGGGMGKITVYGKEDGRGRIVDRVVVKDTTSIGFDEEENWYGKVCLIFFLFLLVRLKVVYMDEGQKMLHVERYLLTMMEIGDRKSTDRVLGPQETGRYKVSSFSRIGVR